MKKTMLLFLVLAMVEVLFASASAEGMISVTELREQTQAMGGVWQTTIDTKKGKVDVNVPIFVPDVESMPVLTLEGADIPEALYERIVQGEKDPKANKNAIQYEIELDGEMWEFFLGYEEHGFLGYEAACQSDIWIQHGGYRFSQGTGSLGGAAPISNLRPWELDPQAACLRGRDMTLDKAMSLWQRDIKMCFPDDDFTIEPTAIMARGSTLTDKTGKSKEYKRDGYFYISARQVIDGVPLLGGVLFDLGASPYAAAHGATQESNRTIEKLNDTFGVGVASVLDYSGMSAYVATEEDYRTMSSLARVRGVEIADVPLAPLDDVLDSLAALIEKGKMQALFTLELGYVLYSNPDMTDHAWAIPRWVVEYITPENAGRRVEDDEGWVYNREMILDAQSGEPFIFTIGDETIYSVPTMKTWDDVK